MSSTTTEWRLILKDLLTKPMKQVQGETNASKEAMEELEKSTHKASNTMGNFKQPDFAKLATGWNQANELVDKFANSLGFAQEYKNLEVNIQRVSGATGNALNDMTSEAYRLSKVYGEGTNEIFVAANSLSQQMGISFDDAFKLINQGFQKGADTNKQFLDVITEYPARMRDAGISAQEFVALQVHAAKSGTFSDKMIDSIAEASLALREMDQAQMDALKGIGLNPEEIAKMSGMQAVQTVSAALDSVQLTTQQKQKAITDIFKSAGEDGGLKMVEGLKSINLNIEELPSVQQAGEGINSFMAKVQSWLAQSFGSAAIAAQQLTPVLTGISSGIGIFQSLTKVTWLQEVATKASTIATKLFGLAMKMTPIGWIATGLGLVTGAIVYLSDKFEWAAGIVGGVKNSFMDFGKVILDVVLLPIKTVINSIGTLGKVIEKLFAKDWSGAWAEATNFANPFKDVFNSAQTAFNSFGEGYDKGVEELREKKANEKSKTTLEKLNEGSPSGANNPLNKNTNYSNNSNSKELKAGSGSSLSGSGGGGKHIVMNLNITNNFSNIKSEMDIRTVADKVCGLIVDRVRDASVSFG